MTTLVTGGAGFIGSHLCERLLAGTHQVVSLDWYDDFYDPATKRENLAQCRDHSRFQEVEGDTLQGLLGTARFLDQHPNTFRIVNVGESRTVPMAEMIDTVARTLGVTPEIERLPMQPEPMRTSPRPVAFSADPQTGFEEGLERFVEWFYHQPS